MQALKTYTLLFLSVVAFIMPGCQKENTSCYNEQLYQLHKNDMCTMDCPGVTGCDGKTYCNECVANSKGISVIK